MREISIDESKQIQLDILKTFIDFCERYHLTYFIAYGTLIGAIRHKGFIPWDDDIDVQMPRTDYEKLIEIFNQKQKTDQYYLVSPYDRMSQHSYAKLIDKRTIKIENGIHYDNSDYLGIDIDINPLDGMPDTQDEYERHYHKMKQLYKRFVYAGIVIDGKGIKNRLLKIYQFLCRDRRYIVKKAERKLKKYPYEESQYIGNLSSFFEYYNDRHKRVYYSEVTTVQFEGINVNAPIGYDHILRKIYGDYMILPSPDKQVAHHSYSIYWK